MQALFEKILIFFHFFSDKRKIMVYSKLRVMDDSRNWYARFHYFNAVKGVACYGNI